MPNRIITGLCRNKPKALGHLSIRRGQKNLMMDYRATPTRKACLSSSEIIQLGKSTLTRRGTRPGRVALSQSRNSPMSSPSSKRRSSSSTVIVAFCFFISWIFGNANVPVGSLVCSVVLHGFFSMSRRGRRRAEIWRKSQVV